MKIIFSSE